MAITLLNITYIDGTTEQAYGQVIKYQNKLYFDKYKDADGTLQDHTVWKDRYNIQFGKNLNSSREIYNEIGEENYRDFKAYWASQNLPQIKGYHNSAKVNSLKRKKNQFGFKTDKWQKPHIPTYEEKTIQYEVEKIREKIKEEGEESSLIEKED